MGAIGTTTVEGINTVALTSTGAGTSKIILTGGITTSDAAGNNVGFTGPVTISGAVDIDTESANADGTITFSTTIDGDDNGNTTDNLTIDSGDGAISFGGTIGGTYAINDFKINQDGGPEALTIPQIGGAGATAFGTTGDTLIGTTNTVTIGFSDAIYKFGGDTTIKAGTTSTGTTFSGQNTKVDLNNKDLIITNAVVIADGELDINSAGGNITLQGAVTSAGVDEGLRLDDGDSATGIITLGSTVSTGDLTLIGDDGILLGGNLTATDTANSTFSFTGPVTLTSDVTIDADANTSANGTDVTFTSTATTINANSAGAGAEDLIIDTGAGNVTIAGVIGGVKPLGALTIDNADGAGNIEVFDIGTASAVGVRGNTAIGNALTDALALDGDDYRTTGSQTYTAKAGDTITIGIDDTPVEIITTDTGITFSGGDIVLKDSADTVIATQAVGATASAGNISIGGAIHGTDGDTTTDVTLNAGTGTLSLQLIDGVTTDINDITITAATTTLNKNVKTKGSGNLSITGNVALATGAIVIDTSNGGGGTVGITGTLSGTQELDILSGSALTTIGGNIGVGNPLSSLDINQSGTGGVTLSGNIGVDGTAGAGTTRIGTSATTGTITLGGTLHHTGAATYSSDNFSITGTDPSFKTTDLAVEFAAGPSSATVKLADASDLSITTGNGNITFGGDIIELTGVATDVTLDAGTQTASVKNIGANADINAVSITAGTISTNGTITTAIELIGNLGNVTLTGAVSLAGATAIDTSSNGGAVGIVGGIDGGNTLTITSGTGNVDVSGTFGATNCCR